MKEKKKKTLQFIYLGVTLLIFVAIGFMDPNLGDFFKNPPAISNTLLLWSIACIIGYWLTDGAIIKFITSFIYGRITFKHAMKLSIIGQFYSAITPASTGGQPAQVLYMKRDGVPVGQATCIISIKFLGFETGLCSFYILGVIIQGGFLYTQRPDIFWLTTAGFLMNAAAIFFIFMAMIRTEGLRKFISRIISGLSKIRIVKKKEKALAAAEKTIGDFREAVGYIRNNRGKMLTVYLISLLHHLCMFSVSFFIYEAFGLSEHTWMELMTLQALLYVAVSFIPTPGGTIVSEGGFYLFFSMYFPKDLVFVSLVLWRLITYYAHIVAGAGLIVFDQLAYMSKRRKKDVPL
jgi:uncharacterized protein (TIRG00374 family)